MKHFVSSCSKVIFRAHVLLLSCTCLMAWTGPSYDPDHFLPGLGIPDFPLISLFSRLSFAILFGVTVWSCIDLGYTSSALAAYFGHKLLSTMNCLPAALFPDPFDTRAWTPGLRSPLLSTSLEDFWTYRWHR